MARDHSFERLRRAFQQATEFAVGQRVDLFVQAGDLFDTAVPDERDRSFVAARLAQLRQAGIRTFAIESANGQFDIASLVFNEAKARRVVAPVNACAGIPTEALEQAVVGDMLESLKELVDAESESPMHERAMAVITKATGRAA